MLKKIFNPKGWLIGAGAIHAIMGIFVQLTMSADVAEMGWGKGAVAAHDVFYEGLMGIFIIPHVVAILAAAFLFTGGVRAKLAAVLGGSMMASFVGAGVYAMSHGYMAEMGSIAAFAPPIILFGGLTMSGVLHWKDA